MQRCFRGKWFGCRAIRCKPQVFSLLLLLFNKKTKIRRRKLGAIEGSTLAGERLQGSAYLHCINFGIVDAPARSVFLVVGDRRGYCAARRTVSIGSVGSETGAGHPASYQYKPTYEDYAGEDHGSTGACLTRYHQGRNTPVSLLQRGRTIAIWRARKSGSGRYALRSW